ncbi:MAG: enoyl-CoA hydratase [Chloroflexi bacterium RBG_16_68_14]|nr:MAG: enoyl-CoA hydratase [Chloroflexi bacterium RBG_16_68_14]
MPDYRDYQYLLLEKRDDGVAVLTMNRPEKRNAVNNEMHSELERVFREIGDDEEIRALVLTGAGKAFCAGGDAKSMEDGSFRPTGPATPFRAVRTLIHNLLEVEQPIVAAVNGDAAGLGATLALYCDVIIASETARLADTHVRMGLVAGDGGIIIWPLLIGWARAKEYLFTGDWITGKEGAEIGLVTRAVPPDQVLPTAMDWARRFAAGAPMALRWTKYSMNKILRDQLNVALDVSTFLEAATMHSEDLKEAATAFLEKREPKFKGR